MNTPKLDVTAVKPSSDLPPEYAALPDVPAFRKSVKDMEKPARKEMYARLEKMMGRWPQVITSFHPEWKMFLTVRGLMWILQGRRVNDDGSRANDLQFYREYLEHRKAKAQQHNIRGEAIGFSIKEIEAKIEELTKEGA